MEFTASDGFVVNENIIKNIVDVIINDLKVRDYTNVFSWGKEILEWYLDKEIECQKTDLGWFHIKLYKDITEDELKQLEQLKDYLRL